jgi:quercetin dioxygenase-like cupin family protein
MPFINTKEINSKEIIKGAEAKFVHTDNMTMSLWTFQAGIKLPEHSHPHEQMTKLISGEFEMTVDGESKVLTANDVVVIPSNAVHSGRAITECQMLDVFHPAREDYK